MTDKTKHFLIDLGAFLRGDYKNLPQHVSFFKKHISQMNDDITSCFVTDYDPIVQKILVIFSMLVYYYRQTDIRISLTREHMGQFFGLLLYIDLVFCVFQSFNSSVFSATKIMDKFKLRAGLKRSLRSVIYRKRRKSILFDIVLFSIFYNLILSIGLRSLSF